MENFNIKIKSSQQAILEKESPPPTLNYAYTLPGKGNDSNKIQVICQEKVIRSVHNHAISTNNEVGGILVGNVYKWGGIYYVMVDDCIQGTHMETGRAHARFTADTWAQAASVREKSYPNKIIIGWYHSHPNLGIFLSHMDLEIHKNFFQSPWHIAMVVDAQNNNMGFFGWEGKQISTIKKFSVPSQPGLSSQYAFSGNNGIINYTNKKYRYIEQPTANWQKYWWISFISGIATGILLYRFISKIASLFPKTKRK